MRTATGYVHASRLSAVENAASSCASNNDQPRIVASIAGLNLTLSPIVLRETNRTPEYLAKFPHGKVPAFEGPDGFLLTESTAIAKYGTHTPPIFDGADALSSIHQR